MAISFKSLKAGHLGMAACCAIMLVPVGGYLLSGAAGGTGALLGSLAPLAVCLGAHAVLFMVLGKSCHGSTDQAPSETVAEVPDYDLDPVREVAPLRPAQASRAA